MEQAAVPDGVLAVESPVAPGVHESTGCTGAPCGALRHSVHPLGRRTCTSGASKTVVARCLRWDAAIHGVLSPVSLDTSDGSSTRISVRAQCAVQRYSRAATVPVRDEDIITL